MTANEIIMFISDLPWWVWVGLFLAVAILTGDTKKWEYEVKFPLREGIGRGEIELKHYKKKGTMLEVKLQLEQSYRNREVRVYLNNNLIHTILADQNTGNYLRATHKVELRQPKEGDDIRVEIGADDVFSGPLVLD